MKTKIFTYLTLVLMIIGGVGCSSSSNDMSGNNPGVPGANEVWMQNTAFNPASKTITAGTTITWTNKDASIHDVTSDTGVFTSPAMGQNATFSFTFTTAGTYHYTCLHHAGIMKGTVIVH